MSDLKSTFIFVGNDQCLDFINTEIARRGKTIDLISSFADFVEWLTEMDYIDHGTRAKLLEKPEPEHETELIRVKEFRSHLKPIIQAVSSGKPLRYSHLEPINEILSKDAAYKKLILIDSEPRLISHKASQEFDPLTAIASAAAALLTEKETGFVRQCEGEGCELYFYDESKNHARRWCSMKRCGNRLKAALHYKKKKAGTAGV